MRAPPGLAVCRRLAGITGPVLPYLPRTPQDQLCQ